MINIYRPVRYSESDTFIFQGDDKHIREIKSLVNSPLSISSTKSGSETGYFLALRIDPRNGTDYRQLYFEPIKNYLRSNYVPVEIHLSAFKGDKSLSQIWEPKLWASKVEDAIKGFFQSKGFFVRDNQYAKVVDVQFEKSEFQDGDLELFRGYKFWVTVGDDYYPILWMTKQYWLYLDGQPVGPTRIIKDFGDRKDIGAKIRECLVQSSEEQFDFLQKAVRGIPALAVCEDIRFNGQAVKAADMGYETWFWPHDSNVLFQAEGEYQTILNQSLFLRGGKGFLKKLSDILIVVLLPEPNSSPVIPSINWDLIAGYVKKFTTLVMPEIDIPFQVIKYPVNGSFVGCLEAVKAFVQVHQNRQVLCIMPIPEKNAYQNIDENIIAADQQTSRLNKAVRDIFRNGYVETLDWNGLADSESRNYILENALMGGFYRLGAQPWELVNMPFELAPPDANCFMGLTGDIDRNVVSATLFDSSGKLIAYGGECPAENNPQGIDFDGRVSRLIRGMLQNGFSNKLPKPKHIIFHLAADFPTKANKIITAIKAFNLTADIISVHPNSPIRFWQSGNKQGTPSNGVSVGCESLGVVHMMNTYTVGEYNGRDHIYPSPSPVSVYRHSGNTSLKTLAAHVYWLSQAHIHSLRRTVDLPVTIAYSQSLLNHIRQTHKAVLITQNHEKTLYWL